jgi:hypothetical protein
MGAPGLRALRAVFAESVQNRDERMQLAALQAIHWSTEADATEAIIKVLENTKLARRTRVLAAELIGKRRGEAFALASDDARVVTLLIRAVNDSDEEIRSIAADYLSRMASVPPDLETTVRSLVAKAETKKKADDFAASVRAGRSLDYLLESLQLTANSFSIGYNAYGRKKGQLSVLSAPDVARVVWKLYTSDPQNVAKSEFGASEHSLRWTSWSGLEYSVFRVADKGYAILQTEYGAEGYQVDCNA